MNLNIQTTLRELINETQLVEKNVVRVFSPFLIEMPSFNFSLNILGPQKAKTSILNCVYLATCVGSFCMNIYKK